MKIERLRMLVNFLENFKNTPTLKFNMRYFFLKSGDTAQACMFGLAGMHPDFNDLGLFTDSSMGNIKYHGTKGVDAAIKFLDIDYRCSNDVRVYRMISGSTHSTSSRSRVLNILKKILLDEEARLAPSSVQVILDTLNMSSANLTDQLVNLSRIVHERVDSTTFDQIATAFPDIKKYIEMWNQREQEEIRVAMSKLTPREIELLGL